MALSGMCILWAERLYPEAPARGVTLSFLGLGAGQTIGAPAAGIVADHTSLAALFAMTALISLAAWYQISPRLGPPVVPSSSPRSRTAPAGGSNTPSDV